MIQDNQDELKIGELPELNVVTIEEIIFHEHPDMERANRLIDRLGAEKILRNPPIVARSNDHQQRILLDGNNRVTAFIILEIPHVVVQEIDLFDPRLVISEWHHIVEFLSRDEIFSHIEKLDLQIEKSVSEYNQSGLLCRLKFADESIYYVLGSRDLCEKIEQLKAFTDLYHAFAKMDRVSYTNMEHLQAHYKNMSMLVSFPSFSKIQIQEAVKKNVKFPSGVTRVILPKRALQVNVTLKLLRSKKSIEEKRDWLKKTVGDKIKDKQIRFYREPTFYFDE